MFVETGAQEQAKRTEAPSAEDRRLQVIKDVIEEIRPNLQRDGGDHDAGRHSIEDRRRTG